jgi:hypothetical protein
LLIRGETGSVQTSPIPDSSERKNAAESYLALVIYVNHALPQLILYNFHIPTWICVFRRLQHAFPNINGGN